MALVAPVVRVGLVGSRPVVLVRVGLVGSCPVGLVGLEALGLVVRVGLEAMARVVRAPASSDPVVPATIGAGGSMAPRGETACLRGAGARLLVLRGTGCCRHRGVLRHRQSTTSATCSSQCGIPATTNGASGSSGFGFRCPSDESSHMAASETFRGVAALSLWSPVLNSWSSRAVGRFPCDGCPKVSATSQTGNGMFSSRTDRNISLIKPSFDSYGRCANLRRR